MTNKTQAGKLSPLEPVLLRRLGLARPLPKARPVYRHLVHAIERAIATLGECYATDGPMESGSILYKIELGNTGRINSEARRF